ncbi:MAG: glycerol-3-phosphate 1-O-acyltransferase PlsY [Fidelibacterota bacterium]
MFQLFLIVLSGYLLGSIPTSLIVGKIHSQIDIRKHGSGNAGMTNIYRVLGMGPALSVAVVDILKGWLAAAVLPNYYPGLPNIDVHFSGVLTGSAAVLGHTYTIFAGFRGGKGVATLLGLIIALYPYAIPICALVFILTLITWGYVSVSSITATGTLPLFVWILPQFDFPPAGLSLQIFTLIVFFYIVFTHRSNISRLRKGTENRFDKVVLLKKTLKDDSS